MISVSDNVKNACNSGGKIVYREFIRVSTSVIPFTILKTIGTTTDIDIKGNLSANAYTDSTFFGTFNMKMLEFEAENSYDFKGKEFDYYKEVNGEAFKIGRFIVTEVKDSDTFENVIVTAYDYGLKFANKYESDLNFTGGTVTFKQYVNEICTKCGVQLQNTTLVGENVIITENPGGTDVQFGNAIAYAAGFQGTFATINQDDKLEFILENITESEEGEHIITEDSDYISTELGSLLTTDKYEVLEDYTELDDKRDTRPITCVLVAIDEDHIDYGAVAKDASLVAKYGENWLKIIGNPLIRSTAKCQEIAPLILSNVKGFGYSAFESKYSFKPYYTLGDIVRIKKADGTLIKSNILRITTEYDDITLQAPSIINASVEYETITQDNKINDALISIDKANAQIVLKADSDGKIVKAELNADADEGSSFNVKADNINLEGYTTINNGFSIDNSGNMTANNGTFTGGEIHLSGSGSYSRFDIQGEGILSEYEIQVNPLGVYMTKSTGLCNLIYGNLVFDKGDGYKWALNNTEFKIEDSDSYSSMSPDGTWSPGYYNSSQESKKKNISSQENMLEKIYASDIVNFNWKFEDDDDKKHIGLIIPDEGGDYTTPSEVITHDGDAIDLYSMCGASWKAIQELYDIIKLQQEKITELERKVK